MPENPGWMQRVRGPGGCTACVAVLIATRRPTRLCSRIVLTQNRVPWKPAEGAAAGAAVVAYTKPLQRDQTEEWKGWCGGRFSQPFLNRFPAVFICRVALTLPGRFHAWLQHTYLHAVASPHTCTLTAADRDARDRIYVSVRGPGGPAFPGLLQATVVKPTLQMKSCCH